MVVSDDYVQRLARLRTASKGATVTIPEGWTAPLGSELGEDLRPGDRFEHDGSDDSLPWVLDSAAVERDDATVWYPAMTLAALGLDVDGASESVGYVHYVRSFNGERVALPADEEDDQEDEDDDPLATVTVRVVPDASGFCEALEEQLQDVEADVPARLEKDQRERVASLENALRILESRRAPTGERDGFAAALQGSGKYRPEVAAEPLIDVAAFIWIGDKPGSSA